MKTVHGLFFALLVLCMGVPVVADAITISYALESLGGANYRATYTVTNNGSLGAATSVGLFSIAFDPALYHEASLSIVTPASIRAEWNEAILASAPGVPALYDALATAGGIPVGSAVTGFAVTFSWIGPGTPGAQPFTIYNPATFAVLETGATAQSSGPGGPGGPPGGPGDPGGTGTAIPTLSTWGFIGLALLLALGVAGGRWRGLRRAGGGSHAALSADDVRANDDHTLRA